MVGLEGYEQHSNYNAYKCLESSPAFVDLGHIRVLFCHGIELFNFGRTMKIPDPIA